MKMALPTRCVQDFDKMARWAREPGAGAWAAWAYSGSVGFSLVNDPESPELDPETTKALGLE
jgi:hypothetical protein